MSVDAIERRRDIIDPLLASVSYNVTSLDQTHLPENNCTFSRSTSFNSVSEVVKLLINDTAREEESLGD